MNIPHTYHVATVHTYGQTYIHHTLVDSIVTIDTQFYQWKSLDTPNNYFIDNLEVSDGKMADSKAWETTPYHVPVRILKITC